MIKKQVQIINKLGLHARASSKLVSLASKYKSNILITRDNKEANAKSIMAVMMLAANKGSFIDITTDGEDEDIAMVKICQLIDNKFDEVE
jgi:phosphocarrier protein HPr